MIEVIEMITYQNYTYLEVKVDGIIRSNCIIQKEYKDYELLYIQNTNELYLINVKDKFKTNYPMGETI